MIEPTSAALNEAAKIRVEQVKLLYNGLKTSIPISFVIALVSVSVLQTVISNTILYFWLGTLILILAIRGISAAYFFKKTISELDLDYWYQIFFLLTVLTALTWGIGVWYLFPLDSVAHQAFWGMIIAGLSAGAISTLSSSLAVASVFILLAVTPLWVRFLTADNDFSMALGGLSLLFQIGVLFSSRQINRSIVQNVKLRHQSNVRENELRQSKQSLQESEEKYRCLFELSLDPMWIIQDKKIILTNQAAIQAMGYQKENELLSQHPATFSTTYQENGVESVNTFDQLLDLATTKGHCDFEWIFQNSNATAIPTAVSLTRIPMDGKSALFCIWRDISEHKKSEKALLEAQQKSEQASQTKSQFLATMSHELRTPMNGILGMAELLSYHPLPTEQKEYLRVLQNSSEHLMGILNDILDFSTLESGNVELKISTANLKESFTEINDLLNPKALKKGLKLELELPPDLPQNLMADIGKIRQVMLILVGNAIKFTEQGSVKIRVEQQSCYDKSVTLKVSVEDTGIGIETEHKEKIFESFTQADSSSTRAYGGTGLGLAICQKLVQLMHGRISVESVPSQGSFFWFELKLDIAPQIVTTSNRSELIKGAEVSPEIAQCFKKAKVLLAEDLFTNQVIATSILDFFEIKYDIANDGLQVLEKIKDNHYDLILMDCLMPNLDGYEATREIRKTEDEKQHIPIIALTASAMESDRLLCLAAGMDDFISKPLNLIDLKNVLIQWLESPDK